MKKKYNRTDWADNKTPVNAKNLNNIEKGIRDLYSDALDSSEIIAGNGISINNTNDGLVIGVNRDLNGLVSYDNINAGDGINIGKSGDNITISLDNNFDNFVSYTEQNKDDNQRINAAANILNQSSNNTGKLGYKILQPSISIISQINQENTIYEIKDVFNLNNGTLNVPSGCTLLFRGGMIKNGTIVGNNTTISASSRINSIFSNVLEKGQFIKDIISPISNYQELFENNNLLQNGGFKDNLGWEIINCSINDGLQINGKGYAKQTIQLEGGKRYLGICYANIESILNVKKSGRPFYSRAGIGFRIKDYTNIDGEYSLDIDFVGNLHETGYVPIIYVFDVDHDVNPDCCFGQIYSGYSGSSSSDGSGNGNETVIGNILHAGIYDISNIETGIPNYKKIYTEYKKWVENYTNIISDVRDTIFSDTQAIHAFIDEMNKKAYYYNMLNTIFTNPQGSMGYADMYNDSITYVTTLGPTKVEESKCIRVSSGELTDSTISNTYIYDNVNPNLIYELSNTYLWHPNYVQAIGFYIVDNNGEETYLDKQSLTYMSQVLYGAPWDPYDSNSENNYKHTVDFREPLLLHIPSRANRIKVMCAKYVDGDTENPISPIMKVYSNCPLLEEKHLDISGNTTILNEETLTWHDTSNNRYLLFRVNSNRTTAFDLCKLEIAAASFRPIQEIWNKQIGEPEVLHVGSIDKYNNSYVQMRRSNNYLDNHYFRLYGKGGSHTSKIVDGETIYKDISLPSCVKNYSDNKWYGLCIARYHYLSSDRKSGVDYDEGFDLEDDVYGIDEDIFDVDENRDSAQQMNSVNTLLNRMLGYYRNDEGYRDPNSSYYFNEDLIEWETYCIYEGQSDAPLTFSDADYADYTSDGTHSKKGGCYKYAFGKNIFKSIHPMSATKTMTAIVALEYLKPTDYICYTKADMFGGSGNNFSLNSQMTLRDAMFFLWGNSDNSIANCICRSAGYKILSSKYSVN